MKKLFFSITLAAAPLAGAIAAQPGHSATLAEAARATREKVPQVAVEKLRALLGENLSSDERAEATRELGRALVALGRARDALAVLGTADDESRFLRAEAFAALGQWAQAEPIFQALAESECRFAESAARGWAESLHARGETDAAAKVLENLVQKKPVAENQLLLAQWKLEENSAGDAAKILTAVKTENAFAAKWKQVLEGRVLLAHEQAAPALAKFEEATRDRRDLTENLYASATIGAAEARIVLNGLEAADNVIEDYIWQQPESSHLEIMFARLDRIYDGEENPSSSELQKWMQKPPRRRAAFATFYYAKAEIREKRTEKALRTLGSFVSDYPGDPLVSQAWLLQGQLLLSEKPAEAIAAFEAALRTCGDDAERAAVELELGNAHFKQREFLLAANFFRSAAAHSPQLWSEATYDAALAWLNLGNYEQFFEDYKKLSARFPESSLRQDLLLEEGLLQARSGDPRAATSLRLFLRDFPSHARAQEARIALAEIAYLASDAAGAEQWLRVANKATADGGSERGDYLAIFAADAEQSRDDSKVIARCEKFASDYPNSTLLPDVRMKLGQIYFRREDYANAETEFENLAQEVSGTPLAQTCLFLAGQSAMRSMSSHGLDHAIDLFGQVAKLNGSLKLYARQEQAIAKSRGGQEAEAVDIYDSILHDNPTGGLRFAALCGKADNLLATNGKDAKTAAEALALYDQIAGDPEVTHHWRDQALYKKAKFLEKNGETDHAITAFYDVLQPSGSSEPEFFWYFKAGFDAARLLEAQEKFAAAIGIYEKMAATDGPRAEEAQARANQLRLEHFIWNE